MNKKLISIFIKNFTNLSLNQGLNIIVTLLVTPFLFQRLGESQYGFVNLSFSIVILLSIIVSYGYNLNGASLGFLSRQSRWGKIKKRAKARKNRNIEEFEKLTKEFRKQRNLDKKHHILQTLDKELDARDRWLGIKALKTKYNPIK